MWQNTCCKTKQIEPKPNIWSQLENTSPSAYQNNLLKWKLFLPFCTFDFPQGYQICWFAWFSGGAAFLTVSGGFLPSGLYAYEFLQEANV